MSTQKRIDLERNTLQIFYDADHTENARIMARAASIATYKNQNGYIDWYYTGITGLSDHIVFTTKDTRFLVVYDTNKGDYMVVVCPNSRAAAAGRVWFDLRKEMRVDSVYRVLPEFPTNSKYAFFAGHTFDTYQDMIVSDFGLDGKLRLQRLICKD